jgi:hypothetical protein
MNDCRSLFVKYLLEVVSLIPKVAAPWPMSVTFQNLLVVYLSLHSVECKDCYRLAFKRMRVKGK